MDVFQLWHRDPQEFQTDDGRYIHPDDRAAIDGNLFFEYHKKYLNTFPSPFWGALRTAPLVLLFASPGNTQRLDEENAADASWRRRRCASFNGTEPLTTPGLLHAEAERWICDQVRSLLELPPDADIGKTLAKIAIADLTAYRGARSEWHEVAFLRTTLAMRDWAQTTLFPQGKNNERIVIIHRARQWWGVPPGKAWSLGSLFAPETTRGGNLIGDCEVAKQAREMAKKAVDV